MTKEWVYFIKKLLL